MSVRFFVKTGNPCCPFDSKTEEFLNVKCDTVTDCRECCRILNVLNQKAECCNKKLKEVME